MGDRLKPLAGRNTGSKYVIPHEITADIEDRVVEPKTFTDIDVATHLNDIVEDEKYETKKLIVSIACFISTFVGVFLTLFSLSATVLFEQYPPEFFLFIVSLAFYLPFAYWIRFFFFPGTEETKSRRILIARRKIRQRITLKNKNAWLTNLSSAINVLGPSKLELKADMEEAKLEHLERIKSFRPPSSRVLPRGNV